MKFFLALLIFLGSLHTAVAQKSRLIEFNENRPLTWKDFKGRPNKKSSAAAVTSSGIEYHLEMDEKEAKIMIRCTFSPKESWTKTKTDLHILSHEQFHFNITELHARKLRKEISAMNAQLEPKQLAKQIAALYKSNAKELNRYQKNYDRETEHSIKKEKQKAWEARISKELASLSQFSHSEIQLFLD